MSLLSSSSGGDSSSGSNSNSSSNSGVPTAEILYQNSECVMSSPSLSSPLPDPLQHLHLDYHSPLTPLASPTASTGGGGEILVGGGGGGGGGRGGGRQRRRRTPPKASFDINDNSLYSVYCFFKSLLSASTASTVAIDNKIEQAMDLVKSHLMFAVREEVEVLKEKITELLDRISQLEYENVVLRQYATQEALQKIQQHHASNT